MALTEKLLKIAGKEELRLDKNISKKYIISLLWKYGLMMIRGRLFAVGYTLIHRSVFIGKRVKVLEKKHLSIGEKAKIHDNVYIDALSVEGVSIGKNSILGRNTRIECTGSIRSIGKGLIIGDRTTFGSDCFFGAAGGIEIGDDVVAGQYIRFHSENHTYDDLTKLIKDQGVTHKGIIIRNNCWIGAGAVFLDGAELGEGCVVAANAVVTKAFPENSVIGGVPAKIIKKRGYTGHE